MTPNITLRDLTNKLNFAGGDRDNPSVAEIRLGLTKSPRLTNWRKKYREELKHFSGELHIHGGHNYVNLHYQSFDKDIKKYLQEVVALYVSLAYNNCKPWLMALNFPASREAECSSLRIPVSLDDYVVLGMPQGQGETATG
jgi:hypothetical protein